MDNNFNNGAGRNNFEQDQNSLKDYLNLVWANIFPISLIAFACLIASILYAINAVDIYKTATVLKLAKPSGNILESPLMPEFQDFGSDRFIANEIEILKSYTIREKVAENLIARFNESSKPDSFYLILNFDPDTSESNTFSQSVKKIQSVFNGDKKEFALRSVFSITEVLFKNVTIEQKRGLDIVEISVESPSPYEAALISNTYADAYRELNLQYNRQQLISVKKFLDSQREEKLNELITAEDRLKTYQEEGGIIELGEQAKALIEQLTDFESKKNATKIDLTISEKSLSQYKQELAEQNPRLKDYLENLTTEPYLNSLQKQIAELQTKRDLVKINSANKTADISKTISDYDKQISELQEKVKDKISIYRAGIFASSPEEIKQLTQKVLEEQIRYQSLASSFNELDKIVRSYEKRFNELPKRTIDLARLQREKSAFEKLYLLVEEKYQEALINEQSTPGNVLIIDEARIPIEPAKPNRKLIILVGLFLGVSMGVGFALVRNYFDNSVKTPEDIQKKNINVLTWIPKIEGINKNNKEFEFIFSKRPDSIPSEAFRALRTRIQFSKIDQEKLKTILITSATPGEGKTTVAVNLAGSFAHANKKTVIVDCDLRKPRMHSLFEANRFPGFTDYFFSQASYEEVLKKSTVENLYFITAGTIPPNPSEIIGSVQMERFLEKLKKEFDYVIIDSPPVIAVTDSEILSRLVDASILVVSANSTEIDLMERGVELLKHEYGSFIGTVLNNFSYRSGYGSYYKYYYYYSHGGKDSSRKKEKV
ncbi:MAG: polysaccharide biosynthesis tyrosine autokinase [Bacteroidetes bacterium]|nr:polysaccharide biosynthesis tyrosine autokinase [Bacteroidota bacterium]